INAHADFYDDLSILQLDAHTDLRDEYQGNPYSHASVMARVREKVDNIVSVGIRSMDSGELASIREKKVFYAHKIASVDNWMDRAADRLSPNVYITIDLDVFDPGIMPSTGTPEPGGLDWYTVIRLLKRVAEKRQVVGFDVVELCPSQNKAPDFLAAKLIYKLLSYISFFKIKEG
ncbi:arginase family protein, partial [bacterium]|nr:arginase family protein [bacterium]